MREDRKPAVGDAVRVRTATRGCYHGKTGRVTNILNGPGTDIRNIPTGSPDAYPYWYRVEFDSPADNGGKPVDAEIFMLQELEVLEEKKGGID